MELCRGHLQGCEAELRSSQQHEAELDTHISEVNSSLKKLGLLCIYMTCPNPLNSISLTHAFLCMPQVMLYTLLILKVEHISCSYSFRPCLPVESWRCSQNRVKHNRLACPGLQMQVEHTAALELLHGRITEANKQAETIKKSLDSAEEESASLKSQLASTQEKCTTLVQGDLSNCRSSLNSSSLRTSCVCKLLGLLPVQSNSSQ